MEYEVIRNAEHYGVMRSSAENNVTTAKHVYGVNEAIGK